MAHLCLITEAYPPEIRSASVLMQDLANELVASGHNVTVLTTMPRYNLARHEDPPPRRAVEGSVRVVRIPSVFLHNVGPWLKALGQFWLSLPIVAAGWRSIPRFDSVIVYTPPLPLVIAGFILARAHRARLIVNVQDLFPQNAIDLGVLKNPFSITFFRRLEQFGYEYAHSLVVHSSGNARWLSDQGYGEKIAVIHNWFDFSPIERDPERRVLAEIGVPARFTVFFGGVMGYAQDLDVILEAAAELRDQPDIQFLLVGDGVDRERAEAEARRNLCANVFFRGFVDPPMYRRLLGSVDVGLLTLRSRMKTPVVPNKLLSFLAAQLPVAAALNSESDANALIFEAGAGINIPAGDGKSLAEAIRKFYLNPNFAAECGRLGREYGLRRFSVRRAVEEYTRLVMTDGMGPLKAPCPEGRKSRIEGHG